MIPYEDFLRAKAITAEPCGLTQDVEVNPMLFPFQRDIVRWALRRGRAAIWADCGLGKTPMQLEFAKHIPGEVLILAPLAVALQMGREFAGVELKESYYRVAVDNLTRAEESNRTIFDVDAIESRKGAAA